MDEWRPNRSTRRRQRGIRWAKIAIVSTLAAVSLVGAGFVEGRLAPQLLRPAHAAQSPAGPVPLRVVALGDSTVYGSFAGGTETVPAYLAAELGRQGLPANVFNFGYPGALPADLRLLLAMAPQAQPDLVTVNVDVVYFAERVLQDAGLSARPASGPLPEAPLSDSGLAAVYRIGVQETPMGQYKEQVAARLTSRTALERIDPLAAELHPDPARERSASQGVRSWQERSWGEAERAHMARIYTQGSLRPDNPSLLALRDMARLARTQRFPVLFYINPQNEALIGRFFSLTQLNANEDTLVQALRAEGAWVLDLRRSVPPQDFVDYDHLLAPGNAVLAHGLADEIVSSHRLRRP